MNLSTPLPIRTPNPHHCGPSRQAPVLHRAGVFRMLLATLPPKSGSLPLAAALFFGRFHSKQAHTPTTPPERSPPPPPAASPSFLAPLLPPQLLAILSAESGGGPAAFAQALASEARRPNLFWNHEMREILVAAAQQQLAAHIRANAAVGRDAPFEYGRAPLQPVRYAAIEQQLCVDGIFVRFLVEQARRGVGGEA